MADRKRRWGDRRDGRWVREVTGLQCIMSNLMPNRTDCEVCLQDKIDVTELLPYIEKKHAEHPDYKTQMRKSEHSTGGVDSAIDAFAKIPRLLLMFVIRCIRWLDFWGLVPKSLTEGDPNFTSVFLSNLGSIKCPAVYHHLNNYGTNSFMVTIGTIHKEEVIMPDGSKQIRDMVDFGATLDERIADGFYFARSLKLVRHIFAHPEMLDLPIGEPSGFEYK